MLLLSGTIGTNRTIDWSSFHLRAGSNWPLRATWAKIVAPTRLAALLRYGRWSPLNEASLNEVCCYSSKRSTAVENYGASKKQTYFWPSGHLNHCSWRSTFDQLYNGNKPSWKKHIHYIHYSKMRQKSKRKQ